MVRNCENQSLLVYICYARIFDKLDSIMRAYFKVFI